MSDKLMNMVEKFTQSSTATAMNMESIARAIELLSKDVTTINHNTTQMNEDHRNILYQLEAIHDSQNEMAVTVADNHGKSMKRMASIKSKVTDIRSTVTKTWDKIITISGDTEDTKTMTKQILMKVVEIAAEMAAIIALIKGGII